MNAEIWGSNAWIFLLSIQFTYPHNPDFKIKKDFFNFFDNLKNIIPCEICKTHYKNHLHTHPIMDSLNSKEDLIKWLIKIHNEINIMNGKRIWTYEEVVEHYDKLYENPMKDLNIKYGLIIGILLIVIICCSVYVYNNKK